MTTSIDDVLGPAVSTADAVAAEADAEAVPSFAQHYLETLVVLPGAEHVVVVDASGQRVLAEWGEPGGSTGAVLDRARRAADPSRNGRRQLEDIASTTASAFHLSCFVLAGPGHPESVWVAVRVSRSRGNLTWSKGALARLTGSAGRSAPATVADEAHPVVDDAFDSHAGGAAPAAPAPTVVSPPALPAPAVPTTSSPSADPGTSPAEAPSRARIALTARAVPLTVTAPERLPARPGALTTGSSGVPDTVHPVTAETATTVEMITPAPVVPAARPSSENRPAPSPPGPQRTSSFAPVMVVLPPPAPIPDDGTFEEPAPMPAPIVVAPDLPVAREPVEDDATVDPGTGPSGGAGHPRPPRPAPFPRMPEVQQPATRLPAPTPAPPSRPPASGTTGSASTDESSMTRRLIHGLRRRS